jgi:tRNA threonylcarbamoyladenosine biosynthesis protein TsaE
MMTASGPQSSRKAFSTKRLKQDSMSDTHLSYTASSEADTERLGAALARALADGGVVSLSGPLGAGKTRLVQAIAAALGVDRADVVSPTFVLVHEYHGTRPIYHIDAYRLRDKDEFVALGVEEYFPTPNLVLIEWGERVSRCLPDDHLQVTIELGAGDERRFELSATGRRAAQSLARLRTELGTITR